MSIVDQLAWEKEFGWNTHMKKSKIKVGDYVQHVYAWDAVFRVEKKVGDKFGVIRLIKNATEHHFSQSIGETSNTLMEYLTKINFNNYNHPNTNLFK